MREINFNSKLYSLRAIKEAATAYANHAEFKIIRGKKYINVRISKLRPGYNTILADEFSNYVLGVTKRCF